MSSRNEAANPETPSPAQPASTGAKSPFDWSQIKHDIFCPLCGYNLRGLTESRCPECGYRFDWHEMLDPNAAMHPYLFEHHPERNLWSYYRTVLGACRPKRFWTTLHPRQPSRPGRLLFYWMIGALALPLLFCVPIIGYSVMISNVQTSYRSWMSTRIQADLPRRQAIILRYGSVDGFLKVVAPAPDLIADILKLGFVRNLPSVGVLWRSQKYSPGLIVMVLALLWPWLVLAALMIFQISMRRAKVRMVHVLRSVIYSYGLPTWAVSGVLVWAVVSVSPLLCVPASALGVDLQRFFDWLYPSTGEIITVTMTFVVIIAILFFSARMVAAYRWYLRFDHPRSTVWAAQVIAALAMLIVLAVSRPGTIAQFLIAFGI